MAGLAALSGLLAVVVLKAVFPHGSINNDEAIYRLQAQGLRDGHLFVPLVPPPGAFRPWLAALVHHHWVLKYVPVEGGLLAAALLITGTPNAALPVLASAATVTTWLLVREVLEDRWSAIVATALVVLSPLVVVQSALLVGYLPTVVLLQLFTWTLIRATRRPSAGRCVVGGLAFGLAAVARPYDTLLFAGPMIVWVVMALRGKVWGPLGWYVLGALPPLAGLLLFDWAATGDPLRLSFNLLEPADRPGFGARRMFPQESYHAFGWHNGIKGSANHLLLTVGWVAGGPILVLLAVVGLWRRRRNGAAVALAAVALTFPVGYAFFWGAWNASRLWHGVRFIGPFYFLPVVAPIAVFGGGELVALFRRYRPLALGVVAVGLVSTTLVAAPAVAADARWSRQDGAVLAMVGRHAPASGRTLVLVRYGQEPGQEYLMHPISGLANRWDGAGPLVYGLWSATTQDLAVLAAQADRQPYLLSLFGPFAPHPAHLAATVRPLRAASGVRVTLHVSLSAPAPEAGANVPLTIDAGASALSCPALMAGGWDVTVAAEGTISCAPGGGPPTPAVTALALPPGGRWDGRLRLAAPESPSLTLPLQIIHGQVTILTVGPAIESVGSPPAGLLSAR